MPRIGLRIIKSALAVWLCFAIYMFRGSGIPFYSAIAAILCMQPEWNDSYEKGRSRIIATIFGGMIGMLVLALFQEFLPVDSLWLRYSLVSIMIVFILYLAVVLKQPASAYLSCVVFMSITISHSQDENVVFFACNRMLDTLIGIIVAWGVNACHIPHRKNRSILIEVPLNFLVDAKGKMDTYTKIHLNRCIDQGAHLLISSSHTPSGLKQRIQGLHMPVSCLLMDGVLLYDPQSEDCKALQTLDPKLWKSIYQDFIQANFHPFVYEVKDDMLYVHAQETLSTEMKLIYERTRKLSGKHFVLHEVDASTVLHHEMVAMMLVTDEQSMEVAKQLLVNYQDEITWVIHPMDDQEAKFYLRIYPIALAKQDALWDCAKAQNLQETYKVRLLPQEQSSTLALRQLKQAFYK